MAILTCQVKFKLNSKSKFSDSVNCVANVDPIDLTEETSVSCG